MDGHYNKEKTDNNIISYCLHYYNFSFLPNVTNDINNFYYFCKYDYYNLAKFYFETKEIDINAKTIANQAF